MIFDVFAHIIFWYCMQIVLINYSGQNDFFFSLLKSISCVDGISPNGESGIIYNVEPSILD